VYNTLHPDGTAHGGTTLIIHTTVSHYELTSYQTNKIQATSVKIKTMSRRLTVAAIYSPPRHSISADEYKDFLQTLGLRFIVGGDWKAKHTMGLTIDYSERAQPMARYERQQLGLHQ